MGNSVPRPEGCYFFEGRLLAFARNGANAGIGAVGPREPICKELGAVTTPVPAPAPLTPVPTPVPADQIRFVAEISEGTCSDVNGIPINDEDICELAARVLGSLTLPRRRRMVSRGRRAATYSVAMGSS